jgi:uncharacterized DUF497 family protein
MIFDWDNANREHLTRHGVSPEEAEQFFEHDPYELDTETHEEDGLRTKLIGETDSGRILLLLVTSRGDSFRVITAWDAPQKAKKSYLLRRLHDYGY